MKKFEIDDNTIYVTNENFKLYLDDDIPHQFGVLFKIYDSSDFDDYNNKNYPFIIDSGIIVDNPHSSFNEDEYSNHISTIMDCDAYMGTVPIVNFINKCVSSPNKDAFNELVEYFSIKECSIVDKNYLQFSTIESCHKYIDFIIKNRLRSLPISVGFILDQPLNMLGETGWDTITKMIKGK